jgi:TonB family protein
MRARAVIMILALAACGSKKKDPAADVPPIVVKPDQLVRTAGETSIPPDEKTVAAFDRAGTYGALTSWKVCIDATGAVVEASVITSSGSISWDHELADGIRAWKFKPYLVDGQPVRVCTSYTFQWKARP